MSICCFATRYVFATLKLDIFLAFARNSICCLTATRVDSAAPQIVTSLALPNGNAYTPFGASVPLGAHALRSIVIEPPRSNLHSLADKLVCRLASFDFRATHGRRISTLSLLSHHRRSALLSKCRGFSSDTHRTSVLLRCIYLCRS